MIAEVVLFGLLAILTGLLAYKPLLQILNKSKTNAAAPKKKPAAAAPKKVHYDANAPIPEPTPLDITPEQVKTYDDRPWRPFRWPYHQTMSIYKLDINHWLDMDKYYWHYIEEKQRIHHKYGDLNFGWLEESDAACEELLDTVVSHMLKRYPKLFTSNDNGVHVKNELTGEVMDLSRPLMEHPMMYVSRMAKEDFYLVQKRDDGLHYLTAAAVPFPGGSFDIKPKLGKNLDIIHTNVPYYESKLKKSMERWFSKMTASDPVERASWFLSWDYDLFCSAVHTVPNDSKIDPSVDPKSFIVRVERQALRRLPKTQAIIFTNHPIHYTIEEMKDEPMIPSLLKKIMYEAPDDIVKYKHFESFRDHLVPYLDSLIQRQLDLGIITEETPLKTQSSYPFAHWVEQSDETKGWNNAKVEEDNAAYERLKADATAHEAVLGKDQVTIDSKQKVEKIHQH
ncbi:putative secreted protein [Wickerhamomyces ciferrii]|uniref:Secreted protein n=1 Tax=Wickerhamomyces ciferrii (strain ATCC 14091 / BCRC 22168 / CBS 111 / JCM 3599 / NBRC 0793 / NRRL Y-1031 F-60-10) TaxID=1206466 RepID=K0KM56_WICCF|nr:uncharacterized protein BN7_2009 [Wickerhamomyces ciferrii]CCH42464.1 putative secreted protein [Wickerhamomyces ciferrii]